MLLKNVKTNKKKNVLFISSSGGHFEQLREVIEWVRSSNTSTEPEFFVVTESVRGTLPELNGCRVFSLPHGGRERRFAFVFLFTYNFFVSFLRLLLLRPKVIISTGAHTAVPSLLIGKLFGSKIIFFETFARMTTPSLTGRLAYKISDRFYIQSPLLLEYYPNAIYKGTIY